MNTSDGTDREKRWMLLASNGQHSWLGRHTDPTDDEIARISDNMAKLGLGAWLCVAEGDYWAEGYYAVMEVRQLSRKGDFASALKAFEMARRTVLQQD